MDIGAHWSDAYLEPQQKEQSSVMFINHLPKIKHKLSNLRNCLEANKCIYGKRRNYKTKQNKDWTNKLVEILDKEKQLIKVKKSEKTTDTLTTNFHKPAGEDNM